MVASQSRINELFSGSFNPYTFSDVPRSVGTDFSIGGKRDVDIFKTILEREKGKTPPILGLPDTPSSYDTGSAVPTKDLLSDYSKFLKESLPISLAQQEQQARLSAQLTREQLASLYPYLSAVGTESTARGIAASKDFASFMKRPEMAIQDIVASKQQQMASAAGAEASLRQATAMQQDAAKRFAGSFAGKYIQVA